MRKLFVTLAIVVLGLVVLPSARSTPTIIDFEEFRAVSLGGLGGLQWINDFYASLGVHFVGARSLSKADGTLNATAYPPHSGDAVVTLGKGYTATTITFDGLPISVGGYFTVGLSTTVIAYDAANNVVGSQVLPKNTGPGGTPNAWVEFTHASGIAKIVIQDVKWGYTLDDLTLGRPVVPEASTLLLFGLGSSGLLFFARRRGLIKR